MIVTEYLYLYPLPIEYDEISFVVGKTMQLAGNTQRATSVQVVQLTLKAVEIRSYSWRRRSSNLSSSSLVIMRASAPAAVARKRTERMWRQRHLQCTRRNSQRGESATASESHRRRCRISMQAQPTCELQIFFSVLKCRIVVLLPNLLTLFQLFI